VKNVLMLVVIIWFVLGVSSAADRGYFDSHAPRTCDFVGSAALTVISGPLNYAGFHPHADC
jgi:hypothetical protein